MVQLQETDPGRGLAEGETHRRREAYGPNVLPQARRAGPLARLTHQVNGPLVYVRVVAGVVVLALTTPRKPWTRPCWTSSAQTPPWR